MAFFIHGRAVILLGDKTTHGGEVVTASPTFFVDDIPVAREGDLVTCPLCGGIHPIIEGAPTSFEEGARIACHGDRVACGARLLSRNAPADDLPESWEEAQKPRTAMGPIFRDEEPMSAPGLQEDEQRPHQAMGAIIKDWQPTTEPSYTDEEICEVVNKMLQDKAVARVLVDLVTLSDKSRREHSGWIVENPDGSYSIASGTVGEEKSVEPLDRPANAIGNFHTHTDLSETSEKDRDFAALKRNQGVYFFIAIDGCGFGYTINDAGQDVKCNGEKWIRIK